LAESLSDSFTKGGLIQNVSTLFSYEAKANENNELASFVDSNDLIIVACDYQDHYTFGKVNELCHKAGKTWLRVMVDGIGAEIGPLFIPGETCCYACLRFRLFNNLSAEEYAFHNLYDSEVLNEKAKGSSLMFGSFYPVNQVASSVAYAEALKHLSGMNCGVVNQVVSVNCLSFHTETHYIFKDYQCKVCK